MAPLVSLTSLGTVFTVRLTGVTDAQGALFTESWLWCGGALVDTVAEGSILIEARLGRADDRRNDADAPAPGGHSVLAFSYLALADQVTSLVTRLAIGERRGDLLMLHAGGVADPRTGRVVAFIGPSGRGKTTASIALGSVFGYVTDETLAVRDDLGIVAYPKPLSVKQPAPEQWKQQVGPQSLGLQPVPAVALRLAAIILLDRRPELPEGALPEVSSTGLLESVPELVPQISYLSERSRPLDHLRRVIEACGGLKTVTYREASTLVDVVQALFDDGAEDARGERLAAVFDDAITEDDSLVVLSGRTVRVLGGIAPTILERARIPATIAELLRAVVDAHGAPPDGSATGLVTAAAEELLAAGLLRRVEEE